MSSCAVCHGIPGCPCCTPEPDMIQCPECNGVGVVYYDEDGNSVTKTQYDALPEDARGFDKCEKCDGEGEIEYEYEPDWDSMRGGHDYD